MKTIQDQLDLERRMMHIGEMTYKKSNENAVDNGRGSETTYARRLMQSFMEPLVGDLNRYMNDGRAVQQGRVRPLLRQIEPEKAIFFALKCVFNSFIDQQSPTQIAMDIARYVEDDVRFTRFEKEYKDYYTKIIMDFKRKGTQDYRHMHRVLTHSANELGQIWQPWSNVDRVDLGMRLLNFVLEGTNLIHKRIIHLHNGKTPAVIEPTEETLDWIKRHEEFHKLLNPGRLPCIIPPDDWVSYRQGGYYSPEVRNATPFLKCYDPEHKLLMETTDLTRVFDAVNKIQRTPWRVNKQVLAVVKDVWERNLQIGMPGSQALEPPPSPVSGIDRRKLTLEQEAKLNEWKREAAEIYTAERDRRAKSFQTARIIRLATEYSQYDNFWYVWYSDFRGRHYTATAGFSPQGPDLAKGIIQLGRGVALTERGWYWLRVHGANRYGYDKCSFDERAQWVSDQHDKFMEAAENPLDHRSVWIGADKPWQFLAFLFEYRDAYLARRAGTVFYSHTYVGMDGSCNGLQNFSAMLRDAEGGAATNLVPQDKPADIYTKVAVVLVKKLQELDFHPMARKWLDFAHKYGKYGDGGTDLALPRALSKRPVMTLPYGATRQSCTKYLFEAIIDIDRDFFEANFAAAVWLTPLMWESIGDVVVAARAAMGWLQASASVISKSNEPIIWNTPDNFPVFLSMKKIEKLKVTTKLGGTFQCVLGNFTDNIDSRKQRSGVSPNFVHSVDATHMRETVRQGWEAGIQDWALIHDDYGTHASNIDALHTALRRAFVSVYRSGSPLETFRDVHVQRGFKLKELPPTGDLDIERVADSTYFFS